MVFDGLNLTGKKVKKTHKPIARYCEKQMYKVNKRILRILSIDNNGLMWSYGSIFSEYCICILNCQYKSLCQLTMDIYLTTLLIAIRVERIIIAT